jgi:membrane protease subunit (stomatin/prohibitin family)
MDHAGKVRQRKQNPKGKGMNCPRCNALTRTTTEGEACSFCGWKAIDLIKPLYSAPQMQTSNPKFCPHCGKEIDISQINTQGNL